MKIPRRYAIDKEDYDYRIKVEYDGRTSLWVRLLRNEVDLSKKYVTVEKIGDSRKKSVDEFWAREKLQKKEYRKEDYDKEICRVKDVAAILPADGVEKIKKVGPFTAEMYFLRNSNNSYAIMKRVATRKRKKLLDQFSGIKLYRDDFKVRPYGDEGVMYDWLGMGSRVQKSPAPVAHKTGAWRVQPYQMIGLVKIGRESNPYLEDMANREGIALTDTYYIFVNLLQECLKEFEYDRQYIYREYARWIESIEDEIEDYVKRVQEEAVRQARAYTRMDEKKQKKNENKLVDMYIVLNNFILNSAWFLEQEHNENRRIWFSVKEEEGNHIHFYLEDNGSGLADKFRDNPDRIFEIGETSKGEKGTGLGLWVVKETVERYDGTVSVMEKSKGFGIEIVWRKAERRS